MHISKIAGFVFFIAVIAAKNDEFCDSACGLVALIPARGGSKGIPLKNLAILDGQSLLCRTISIINASNVFQAIWVSTDVSLIADEAISCGAQVHWRSLESALDTAPTLSVIQDFLANRLEIRAVAVVQCTSPFLCPKYLQSALELFQKPETDCVFAATRSFKLRWKIGRDRYAEPENFDPGNRPRRQDWPGELQETGMFYFSTRRLIEAGVLQNNRCKIVEVPANRSLEIDTSLDLETARTISQFLEKC